MFVEFFRRRWVPIRVENIFDADEKEDPILEGQLISTARSIRVGVGALRVEQPKLLTHCRAWRHWRHFLLSGILGI